MNAPLRDSKEHASSPVAGDRIGEKYVVDRVLGQGAAGIVYEAVHDYTGRRVAIKWVHPHVAADATNAARFLREARSAAAVQHPNVVEILDAGRDRDTFYLVMERLEGELLSAAIARGGISPGGVARIFLSMLRGVAAAHALGIVHRDLKPDNVFLARPDNGRPGGAKVLDFGISKLKMQEGELTAAGVFVGSPYYMAPEQIADSRSVDVRADVYSVGVMLYETLSGRLPFDAESLSQLFAKIVSEKPPSLDDLRPDLPPGLSDLVGRAMEPLPKERFATVRALATALESFSEGMQFDPGGDAFEQAWRERATMHGEETGWRERPSTVVDDLLAEPTRRAAEDQIFGADAAGEDAGDAASSAIESARARAARGDLPEQPTLIRPRLANESPSRESATDPTRSLPDIAERITVPPGSPLLVPHTTPGNRPGRPDVPPPPLTGPDSFASGRAEVTEVVRLAQASAAAAARTRTIAIAFAFTFVLALAFGIAFVLVRTH